MATNTVDGQSTSGQSGVRIPQLSQSEFARLLDHLPAGAYLCDADGLITYYNQRAAEVWGRRPRLNDPTDRF